MFIVGRGEGCKPQCNGILNELTSVATRFSVIIISTKTHEAILRVFVIAAKTVVFTRDGSTG